MNAAGPNGAVEARRQFLVQLGLGAAWPICVLLAALMILPALAVLLICCVVAFARARLAADVLRAVEREALIVAVAAATLGDGGELTDADRARLLLASIQISDAVREFGHG